MGWSSLLLQSDFLPRWREFPHLEIKSIALSECSLHLVWISYEFLGIATKSNVINSISVRCPSHQYSSLCLLLHWGRTLPTHNFLSLSLAPIATNAWHTAGRLNPEKKQLRGELGINVILGEMLYKLSKPTVSFPMDGQQKKLWFVFTYLADGSACKTSCLADSELWLWCCLPRPIEPCDKKGWKAPQMKEVLISKRPSYTIFAQTISSVSLAD